MSPPRGSLTGAGGDACATGAAGEVDEAVCTDAGVSGGV